MYPAKVSFLNKQLAYFKGKFLLKRNLLLLGKKIPNVRNRPINPFIRASEHAGFKKKKIPPPAILGCLKKLIVK